MILYTRIIKRKVDNVDKEINLDAVDNINNDTNLNTNKQRVEKKLHYIWVGGGQKPELVKKCIASFHKYCPDYEIIEWNENNFDITQYPLIKMALDERNWALASDVMRMHIMYYEGGIYIDTDCEIVKPLDDLLVYNAFTGYENDLWLGPHFMGGVKHHELYKRCLERFIYMPKLEIDFNTNALTVHALSVMVEDMYGVKLKGKNIVLGEDNDLALFAYEYFTAKNYLTQKITSTNNTYLIHHYTNTWLSKWKKFWSKFSMVFRKLLGRRIFRFFEKVVGNKFKKMVRKELKQIEKIKEQEAQTSNN